MEQSEKYWIDNNGQAYAADRGHLAAVMTRPEDFGRTREDLEDAFRRCGEPVGAEGIARTVILEQVLATGWVQASRDTAKDTWILELWHACRKRVQDAVTRFVTEALAAGVFRPETRLVFRLADLGGPFVPPGMEEPPPLTIDRWLKVKATPLERVSIEHEGQTITGEITYRCASDLTVRITRPYRLLEQGMHIPYFGRPYRDYRTSHGEETARRLLKEIYDRARLLETRREELLGRLADYRARLTDLAARMPLAADREAFLLRRRDLREDRQAGRIDGPSFDREWRGIRKGIKTYQEALDIAWRETLGDLLGVHIWERYDLVDILECREALRA